MPKQSYAIRYMLILLIIAGSAQAFIGFNGWKLSGGMMMTDNRASKSVAQDLGGDPSGKTSLMFSIQTRNNYSTNPAKVRIRYGILISALHEWNYWDTPDSLMHVYDYRVGHGYGAYRIGFMPEIFTNRGDFQFTFGAGIGMGFSKHFVDDNTGENDNEDVYEGFIRPQISIGYGNKTKVELTAGYHQPFLGTYGRYWYRDSTWERVYYGYSPTELAGGFVQLGIFFDN